MASELTDDLLRHEIEQGVRAADIARKYHLTRQAISLRVKKLAFQETTAAVVVYPESQRNARVKLDAIHAVLESLAPLRKLQASYDDWLQDPENPDRYFVGPRAAEVDVAYWDIDSDGKAIQKKASLQELLAQISGADMKCRARDRRYFDVERSEFRHADPRTEFRQTLSDIRATIAQAVRLAELINDARAMQQFRDALLAAISKVSPSVAREIAEACRPILVMHAATGGPGAVPASRDD